MNNCGLQLHHIGVLVRDVERSSRNYAKGMGYSACTGVIHDPQQAAFVQFFQISGVEGYLELIAPDSSSSHLQPTLQKRPGIHHICYIAQDLEVALEQAKKGSSLVVRDPCSAVAFCESRVAWVMNVDGLLVEFVETPAQLLGMER